MESNVERFSVIFKAPTSKEESRTPLTPYQPISVIKKAQESWVKPMSRAKHLPKHIIIISAEKSITYKCTICSASFKSKSNCCYHKHCANEVEKPFECSICNRKFSTKTHFSYHTLMHNGMNPFKCTECGKSFKTKYKLRRHQLVHTDLQKKFACDICGRAFLRKSSIRVHKRLHTGVKPYKCNECSKAFREKKNLIFHLSHHTGIKNWICEVCGKAYSLKWDLELHKRTHSRVRPFRCSVDNCQQVFSQKRYLKRHMETHKSILKFVCGICEKEFSRKDNLQRHIVNTHLESQNVSISKNGKAKRSLVDASRYIQTVRIEDAIKATVDEVQQNLEMPVIRTKSVIMSPTSTNILSIPEENITNRVSVIQAAGGAIINNLESIENLSRFKNQKLCSNHDNSLSNDTELISQNLQLDKFELQSCNENPHLNNCSEGSVICYRNIAEHENENNYHFNFVENIEQNIIGSYQNLSYSSSIIDENSGDKDQMLRTSLAHIKYGRFSKTHVAASIDKFCNENVEVADLINTKGCSDSDYEQTSKGDSSFYEMPTNNGNYDELDDSVRTYNHVEIKNHRKYELLGNNYSPISLPSFNSSDHCSTYNYGGTNRKVELVNCKVRRCCENDYENEYSNVEGSIDRTEKNLTYDFNCEKFLRNNHNVISFDASPDYSGSNGYKSAGTTSSSPNNFSNVCQGSVPTIKNLAVCFESSNDSDASFQNEVSISRYEEYFPNSCVTNASVLKSSSEQEIVDKQTFNSSTSTYHYLTNCVFTTDESKSLQTTSAKSATESKFRQSIHTNKYSEDGSNSVLEGTTSEGLKTRCMLPKKVIAASYKDSSAYENESKRASTLESTIKSKGHIQDSYNLLDLSMKS